MGEEVDIVIQIGNRTILFCTFSEISLEILKKNYNFAANKAAMTIEGLKYIISHSEGTEIEYKKSQTGLARSVYETICAFLNRRGGHVVLGADDDGTIIGIAPEMVQEELDTLAKDMNNRRNRQTLWSVHSR